MIRINNKLAKREVRTMRKEALKQEKTFAILDCWGNQVGYASRNGDCHSHNLSNRTVIHIVVGMMVNKPRAERDMTMITALRDIRALKPWKVGGLA